jgi:hypothetical protein
METLVVTHNTIQSMTEHAPVTHAHDLRAIRPIEGRFKSSRDISVLVLKMNTVLNVFQLHTQLTMIYSQGYLKTLSLLLELLFRGAKKTLRNRHAAKKEMWQHLLIVD